MQTEERLAAKKKLDRMWALCTHWYNRAYHDLQDKALANRVNDQQTRMMELKSNNRRRDKAFFSIMGAIEENVEMLVETEIKPRMKALELAEMMSYAEEVTLIKENEEGQTELVVDNSPLPVDNGTKIKPEAKKMKKEPENKKSETGTWGGKREGAGRKGIGTTRKVSISLPDMEWLLLDDLLKSGTIKNLSEYFRNLHLEKRNLKGGENT